MWKGKNSIPECGANRSRCSNSGFLGGFLEPRAGFWRREEMKVALLEKASDGLCVSLSDLF